MKVKIRIGEPDPFIGVEIEEYISNKFIKYTAEEASLLLTRAEAVDYTENRPPGSYLDYPDTFGIFAPGPEVEFEYQGIRKQFRFGKIPYETIIEGIVSSRALNSVFLERIKAVRSWTDQQIEVRCERVNVEKLGKFDEESSKLFSEGDGNLQVLVQYLMTKGPKPSPNIRIFINGVLCEEQGERRPKDLRVATEYIIAKGAKAEAIHLTDHLSIFTPCSPRYSYGTWKTSTVLGGEINYGGDLREVERALSKRIKDFRTVVTNQIEVHVSVAWRR